MMSIARGPMLFLLLGAASPALAGDAMHGGVVAKRWCAACHIVAGDQTTAKADAPPFADIAKRRPSDKSLAAFLVDPHPKMPDMHLTRREIDDIVSYIRTLDPNAPGPAKSPGEDPPLPRKG